MFWMKITGLSNSLHKSYNRHGGFSALSTPYAHRSLNSSFLYLSNVVSIQHRFCKPYEEPKTCLGLQPWLKNTQVKLASQNLWCFSIFIQTVFATNVAECIRNVLREELIFYLKKYPIKIFFHLYFYLIYLIPFIYTFCRTYISTLKFI